MVQVFVLLIDIFIREGLKGFEFDITIIKMKGNRYMSSVEGE